MKIIYRPELDGIRAISVIAVIMYHAEITIFNFQPFKGGYIGVDIFFVISGYLITSLILNELISNGSFSFKNFFERRIRRILPALLLVMLVTLPFAWMYLFPTNSVNFSKSILFSIGISSNFFFHYSGLEYGAQDELLTQPFLHTWSLSIEEQFYILFPILLFFLNRYIKKYLIFIFILIFFISLFLAEWSSKNYPSFNFYILPTRIWELLAGFFLAYYEIKKDRKNKFHLLNQIFVCIGLIFIGCSFTFFNESMRNPSFLTLFPIIGVSLVIWFSDKNQIITKILSYKLIVFIGLISYSLYLWHYPIFSIIRYYIWFYYDSHNLNLILKFFAFFLIIIFSILSYFFVEKKFRNKNFSLKKLIFIIGLSYTILIVSNLINIYNDGKITRFHPFTYKYLDEHEKFETNYNYDGFNSDKKNVFIVGNSYADDLLNTLDYNSSLQEKYYFYTAVADDIGKNFQLNCLKDFIEKKTNICDGNYFNFFDKQYKKSDYIIFAVRNNSFYLDEKFIETLSLLKRDNKKFIIFLNDLEGAAILDDFIRIKNRIPNNKELEKLELDFFQNFKSFENTLIESVKERFLNNDTNFIIRSEIYCEYRKKKCPLIKNNNKLYTDNGHLTDNGAKYFSSYIQVIFDTLF